MAIQKLMVEDNVPMPDRYGPSLAATLRSMKAGQSVLIAGRSSTAQFGTTLKNARKEGREFAARKVEGGVRIWCTKDGAA